LLIFALSHFIRVLRFQSRDGATVRTLIISRGCTRC